MLPKRFNRRKLASAGGKIVKVDGVTLDNIADQQTAFAALSGRSVDSFPFIESDSDRELQLLDKAGSDVFLRMNFLQKLFNNLD